MPQTQRQAENLLKIAGDLRVVETEETVKAAEDANDPFAAAAMALEQQLTGLPGFQKVAAQEETISMRNAAAQWANDPTIYNSVLSLKAHEAEQLQLQLQAQQG